MAWVCPWLSTIFLSCTQLLPGQRLSSIPVLCIGFGSLSDRTIKVQEDLSYHSLLGDGALTRGVEDAGCPVCQARHHWTEERVKRCWGGCGGDRDLQLQVREAVLRPFPQQAFLFVSLP